MAQALMSYIFKERIERLTKTYILPSLDFDNLGTCVNCIREKFTIKKSATRSSYFLKIIHRDISGPLNSAICGNKFFSLYSLMIFLIWLSLLD